MSGKEGARPGALLDLSTASSRVRLLCLGMAITIRSWDMEFSDKGDP